MFKKLFIKLKIIILLTILIPNIFGSSHDHMMDMNSPEIGEYIQTHHEKILNPVFGSNFSVSMSCMMSICNWEDASTWIQGRVPNLDDHVILDGNVQINSESANALHVVIYPNGSLYFNSSVNTKLLTGDLIVLPEGYLEIGTKINPITAKAEVVIRDLPFDVRDVKQHLRAFLTENGKVRIYGKEKSETFIRVSKEINSGDSSIQLSESVLDAGWEVGDKIIIPHSSDCKLDIKICRDQYRSESEERIITSISNNGLNIVLNSPLLNNHPGAKEPNGSIILLPHIINLERNVVFRSENPLGIRAHSFFHSRSDIDIRYASFIDMGRTNTSYLGEFINIKARYPIHTHHLVGPETPQENGYQFTLIGNVIDFGEENKELHKKWGITIHGSHYGLIEKNIVYQASGAAFVTEDGSEVGNLFNKNFAVKLVEGSGVYDRDPNNPEKYRSVEKFGDLASTTNFNDRTKLGRAGTGFWFNGGGLNIISNNYVADINFGLGKIHTFGFKFDNVYTGMIKIPTKQGNDPHMDDDNCSLNICKKVSSNNLGIKNFYNNEVYGLQGGMTFWWYCSLSSQSPEDEVGCNNLILNFTSWNFFGPSIYAYPNANTLIKNLKTRSEPFITGYHIKKHGRGFTFSDYMGRNFSIENADIYGEIGGIQTPSHSGPNSNSLFEIPQGSLSVIKNSKICAREAIQKQRLHVISTGAMGLSSRITKFQNISFCTGEEFYTQEKDSYVDSHSQLLLTKSFFTSTNDFAKDQIFYENYFWNGSFYNLFIIPDFQQDYYCDSNIADCSTDLNSSFPLIRGGKIYRIKDNFEDYVEQFPLEILSKFPNKNSSIIPYKLNNIYNLSNVTYLEDYDHKRSDRSFLISSGDNISKKIEKVGPHSYVSGTVIEVTSGLFKVMKDVEDYRIVYSNDQKELGDKIYFNFSVNYSLFVKTNLDSICAYYLNNKGIKATQLFEENGNLNHISNINTNFVIEEGLDYNFSYSVDCGSTKSFLVEDFNFTIFSSKFGIETSNISELEDLISDIQINNSNNVSNSSQVNGLENNSNSTDESGQEIIVEEEKKKSSSSGGGSSSSGSSNSLKNYIPLSSINSCIPDYVYSSWSNCFNESQERLRSDINNCKDDLVQVRSCININSERENKFFNANLIKLEKLRDRFYVSNLDDIYTELIYLDSEPEDKIFLILDENTKEEYIAKFIERVDNRYYISLEEVQENNLNELFNENLFSENLVSENISIFDKYNWTKILILSFLIIGFFSIFIYLIRKIYHSNDEY